VQFIIPVITSRDVIRLVTIGLRICGSVVAHYNHTPILHRYGDMEPQIFWGHDLDLLGSRGVIGHVTVGLGRCGFLLVVHRNHASILHRYGDMAPQRFRGHGLDLLGSRDVIGHVAIKLHLCGFLLVVHGNHCTIMEIWSLKHFVAMTSTFWGHVTSSVA